MVFLGGQEQITYNSSDSTPMPHSLPNSCGAMDRNGDALKMIELFHAEIDSEQQTISDRDRQRAADDFRAGTPAAAAAAGLGAAAAESGGQDARSGLYLILRPVRTMECIVNAVWGRLCASDCECRHHREAGAQTH